ncbi:hypothetical protein Tco_0212237 [Tanacetum coccineum]
MGVMAKNKKKTKGEICPIVTNGASTVKVEILLEPTSNKLMVEHAKFDESDTYVLERFDTSAGNPVKEILLKLNLPDHRSILMDSKEYVKMVMEVPDSS